MNRIDRPLSDALLTKMRLSRIVKEFPTTDTKRSAVGFQSLQTRPANNPLIGELEQARTYFTLGWKKDKFG
jgi:hypothetical protein